MKSVAIIAFVIYVLRECHQDPINVHKCVANADVLYRVCCIFPPFFTREISKECGGVIFQNFNDEKHNVTGLRRMTFDCALTDFTYKDDNGILHERNQLLSKCDYWYCVLDKYTLMDSERKFDMDKYYAHLDLWVSLNPVFADVMLEAKVFCKDEFRPQLPLETCSFFNFQTCIRNYIEVDCPIYIESSECLEKKEFLKDCKQFFHRKK